MKKYVTWLFALLWLTSLFYLHHISRSRFNLLWSVYSIAFIAYLFLVLKSTLTLKQGIVLAIILRLSLFFSPPLLSDDYYRFIWDGAVAHAGINPSTYTPREISTHQEWLQAPEGFFEKLNSPDYYTVYPPMAQGFFHLSFLINGWNIEGHIVWIRTIVMVADFFILWLLWLLLKQKHLSEKKILLYGLNPLIILEFSGNVHFDGLMILGLLVALYFAMNKNYAASGLSIAISVLFKMLTLPLIPFLGKELEWRRRILFGTLILLIIIIGFTWSFGTDLHWTQSIALWFNHFEFNASMYYLLRAIGFAVKGYNSIVIIGPCLIILIAMSYFWILYRYYQGKILTPDKAMLFFLTIYFLLSTTVHPWYISSLLVLGILTGYSFPIVWTYLVFLSYSHYEGGLSNEQYPIIATEYILLSVFMIWEIKRTTIQYSLK